MPLQFPNSYIYQVPPTEWFAVYLRKAYAEGQLVKVAHNLVNERSGDYALWVASDRDKKRARVGPGGGEAIGPIVVSRDDRWRRAF